MSSLQTIQTTTVSVLGCGGNYDTLKIFEKESQKENPIALAHLFHTDTPHVRRTAARGARPAARARATRMPAHRHRGRCRLCRRRVALASRNTL